MKGGNSGVSWCIDDGVLVVRTGRRFTSAELAGAFREAVTSGGVTQQVAVLVDNRGSEENVEAEEIRRRVESLSKYSKWFGPRLAVVVSDPLHYGLARMGAAYGEPHGLHLMAFVDIGEAMTWLHGTGSPEQHA